MDGGRSIMGSETAKIRPKVLKYCTGFGADLGCGNDIIVPWAVGVDRRTCEGRSWIKHILDVSKVLPFDTDSLDFVFSSHCLEDIEDTESTLKEWVRVLKSRGYLILYLPHKDLYKGVNPEHKHEFDNDMIERHLKNLDMLIYESYIHKGQYSFVVVGRKR
jgi:predicted SAM-dependent methyltransferase